MVYGVILAGGRGERFWPLSRIERPKQFLRLTSNKMMLEETIDRVLPLIPRDRIRIVSGEEEARLTFAGSVLGLDIDGDLLVVDVGGGSTEIIAGVREHGESSVRTAVSLDIGSVRLFERHVHHDPPLRSELERARGAARAALDAVAAPSSSERLVGVAGTVTTLSAVAQQVDPYDGARVHGSHLDRRTVTHVLGELAALPHRARSLVPGLDPARADVILTGGIVVEAVMDWAGVERLLVSDRGVRWGLLTALRAQSASM